jgi:dihydropteroate synthase
MILDPGIGFSKSAAQSVKILGNLPLLKRFQLPILVGASRKSFLGQILDLPVGERLQASLAAVAAAVLNGAHIVRVHDVKETRQVVRICDAIWQASGSG